MLSGVRCTYISVSLHTQDLLQQRGEARVDGDERAEAQQQDEVGFVLHQLQGERTTAVVVGEEGTSGERANKKPD